MEKSSLFLLLVAVVVSAIWYGINIKRRRKSSKLPPGPYPFPIVGNLFQLGDLIHRALAKLSQKYGPLLTISVGNRTLVVVSSAKLAKELLQKYDHSFVTKKVLDAARALDHHKFSVSWLPIDGQWRKLRKLYKEQIFSSQRLNASQGLRQAKVQQLCDYLHECCIEGKVVDIGAAAYTTSLNFMSNTLFSVDFAHYDSHSSQELKEIVTEMQKNISTPNLADFFPVFRLIDPQGIRRRAKFCYGKLFKAFDDIISRRLQERGTSTSSGKCDLLEVLLDLNQQKESEWSYEDIQHLLLDLFSGGADTTSSTVEWTMAELLKSPGKMKKARAEIRDVIGKSNPVQESDISRLPYLQAVVKEALRLHPATALIARQPQADIEINQYIVPKRAQLFFNLWAIGRDSSFWLDPDSFVPERFLDHEIDFKGKHFELLPFGTGKRICPGMPLADRMVHLLLASFLQNFDWKLEEGMKPEDVDMSEIFGAIVSKAAPLKAIPISTTM